MKKINLLTVLMAFSLGVVGCNNQNNPSSEELPSSSMVEDSSKTTDESSSSIEDSSSIDKSSSEDSSTTEKEALQAPTNLNVVRSSEDNSKFVISFDEVFNASCYKAAIFKDDITINDYVEITSGSTINAVNDEGNYIIKVIAIGNETYDDSKAAEFTYSIENWVNKEDKNGGKWTVLVEQGKPIGKAKYVYNDGTVYEGLVNDDFTRKEGRLTYTNKMYYEGKFVNDNFEDEDGFFSWSTTGDYKNGNSYRGKFVNGTPNGQEGTYTFPSFYSNGTGLQYWTGKIEGFAFPAVGATGKGKINFGGQYYEGDVVYLGNNNFQRVGQGENVWSDIENCGWFANYTNQTAEVLNTKVFDRYVGGFDTVNHGWFYGKGIMYIKNTDGTPFGYVVGNWDWKAGTLTKDETFKKEDLLEEYQAEGVLNITKSLYGEIAYEDGSKFVGAINNDGTRCQGRLTYPNNMYYEGKFVNDKFEDENGLFSWSTTGELKDGPSYRGRFENNTTDGLIGTYTFPSFYNNGDGIQYFTGEMEGMAYPKANTTGKGKINFGGQYYEGDVLYLGDDNFQRVGQGENVWTSTEACGWFANYTNQTAEVLNTKVFDRYVGGFDTVNHGWFYGKGIMYIKNTDGTPFGYVVGNWDWKAATLTENETFKKEDLLKEYQADGILNITKSFISEITYDDGSKFVGKLNADGTKKEGRFTYPNNMYYEGKFVNDTFEDENGFFSWSTTGDHKDANSYRGKFVNGTTANQIGTYIFKSYHTNENGIQYFTGEMEGMAYPKANTTGKGKINFGGQYYEGDVLYLGDGNFQRVGQGENVWTSTEACGWFVNYTNQTAEVLNTKIFDRYVGGFDTINHGWFYGKGIMYIKNTDGTPYGYVVGNWDWAASSLTKDETFKKEDLLKEYQADGVLDLTKNFN